MTKYLKIFSKVVRRMKLKLYMHAYDIKPLQSLCFLLSLSNYFGCFGSLKFPLSYTGKSGNCQFLLFHRGSVNFVFT